MSDYVPSPWEFALLSLAAFRIWKLIADDTILDRPRNWVMRKLGGDSPRAGYWGLFILCPWCSGFWITLVVWAAWIVWPHEALIACVPWAISAAVGLVASAHDKLSE